MCVRACVYVSKRVGLIECLQFSADKVSVLTQLAFLVLGRALLTEHCELDVLSILLAIFGGRGWRC